MQHGVDLSYLDKYPKVGAHNPCRVIHEGLNNRPDIKDELNKIIERLNSIANNDSSHLTDIGCAMKFTADSLHELALQTFQAHEIEKNH